MSGTVSTADRPVYELTEGELIILPGTSTIVRVVEVVRDPEVESLALVHHTGKDSPFAFALTDCVATVVGW